MANNKKPPFQKPLYDCVWKTEFQAKAIESYWNDIQTYQDDSYSYYRVIFIASEYF